MQNIANELKKYTMESSEEDLINACSKGDAYGYLSDEENKLLLTYLLGLLNIKQQKRLVDEQKKSSEKLVIATWVLAAATIIFAVLTLIVN
jgi:hypothetical protein